LAACGRRAAGCHNRLIVKGLVILVGAFLGATLLALLFGAKNLGTAITFGQMGFALTLVILLLTSKRPGSSRAD